MGEWVDIELNKKLFKNVDGDSLTRAYGALENCFVTEANGISRFPGLVEFSDLKSDGDIHINRFGNNMIAVGTDGRSFIVDTLGTSTEIDGPQVLGGDRTSFAKTRDGLMMAAGDQIIRYDGKKNTVLSPDAPLSSFVGFVDGYVMAVEKSSGRWQHTTLNNIDVWPGINTIAVDGSDDNINAMLVTPYNEIMFSGEESIEQYERFPGGASPFFRRWSISDGISEPWTLCWASNSVWGLNERLEFVRLTGQLSKTASDNIQKEIEDRYILSDLGSLDKAWAAAVYIKGQKFIILQSPEASNEYGTKGFTVVLDIRRGDWFEIFGWNDKLGVPDLWPGRSIFRLWGKTFVGGVGKIYEFSNTTYQNDGNVQRAYIRTAHFDTLSTVRINKVKLTIKRGVGSYTANPKIMFRTNFDNKGFNNIQYRDLGLAGNRTMIIEFGAQGMGDTYQFEIACTDNVEFELRRFQLDVSKVTR